MNAPRLYPRRCTKCGIPKAWDAFSPLAGRNEGSRQSACRECQYRAQNAKRLALPDQERKRIERQRDARWRKKNPEKHNAKSLAGGRKARAAVSDGPRRYFVWTSAEMEVAARVDLTAAEVAARLGRTTSGVQNMRAKIKHDPRKARLAGLDNDLARRAAPETINIAPRYEG